MADAADVARNDVQNACLDRVNPFNTTRRGDFGYSPHGNGDRL